MSTLAWDRAIAQIREWESDPDALIDEDVVPPSATILSLACGFAQAMRGQDMPGPLRVVPDGDGGVVFEGYECEEPDGRIFETHTIDCSGKIERVTFRGGQVVERYACGGLVRKAIEQ